MLEDTLGDAGFRDGIRRYMKRYAYGNTTNDQLWAELGTATNRPVTDVAHDFTLQPGVPLVSVATAPCEGNLTAVTLSQARFETGVKSNSGSRGEFRCGSRTVRTSKSKSCCSTRTVRPRRRSCDGCGRSS
jgi:aminopeptidase N